ncbi:MAG: DUF1801 domain-containing protein [Planctomycetota bacterium]
MAAKKKTGKVSDKTARPKLLSSGNPQVAKADGDAPVQSYIEAMPGWKSDVGRCIDRLVVHNVSKLRKAVRWNTPFYGVDGQGWFLAMYCYTKKVRITFFRGTSLTPLPPVESKQPEVRYFDIHETDPIDEELLTRWIQQAAAIPGEKVF